MKSLAKELIKVQILQGVLHILKPMRSKSSKNIYFVFFHKVVIFLATESLKVPPLWLHHSRLRRQGHNLWPQRMKIAGQRHRTMQNCWLYVPIKSPVWVLISAPKNNWGNWGLPSSESQGLRCVFSVCSLSMISWELVRIVGSWASKPPEELGTNPRFKKNLHPPVM